MKVAPPPQLEESEEQRERGGRLLTRWSAPRLIFALFPRSGMLCRGPPAPEATSGPDRSRSGKEKGGQQSKCTQLALVFASCSLSPAAPPPPRPGAFECTPQNLFCAFRCKRPAERERWTKKGWRICKMTTSKEAGNGRAREQQQQQWPPPWPCLVARRPQRKRRASRIRVEAQKAEIIQDVSSSSSASLCPPPLGATPPPPARSSNFRSRGGPGAVPALVSCPVGRQNFSSGAGGKVLLQAGGRRHQRRAAQSRAGLFCCCASNLINTAHLCWFQAKIECILSAN